MRRKVFIVGSIILVLLIARLACKRTDKYSQERKWYVENLNYEFTAVVDSLQFLNDRGRGFLVCRLTGGTFNRAVEDSLNEHLIQYQILRLIFLLKDGRIAKLSGDTHKYEIGDSVYVNSRKDMLTISRNRKILFERKISDILWEKIF